MGLGAADSALWLNQHCRRYVLKTADSSTLMWNPEVRFGSILVQHRTINTLRNDDLINVNWCKMQQ